MPRPARILEGFAQMREALGTVESVRRRRWPTVPCVALDATVFRHRTWHRTDLAALLTPDMTQFLFCSHPSQL
jgi:hypothetical protein